MINFNRYNFYPLKRYISSFEISSILKDNYLNSKLNIDINVKEISSLDLIKPNSILFLDNKSKLPNQNDKIVIITSNQSIFDQNMSDVILVKNLSDAYNLIINELLSHEDNISYFDELDFIDGSHISKFSKIDNSVKIGKNCFIGRGVNIGSNTIIKNNVVIKNSLISSNVIICDNTSIGTTGFGFNFNKRGSSNLNPHIGIVFIDENTFIGSGCAIDRAKIDVTLIGKNCMIDNLVHVGHNVILGDNSCVAAQSGFSGSVKIGQNVTIGGQSGFAGHLNVGNNVLVAARSGVTKTIPANSKVAGFPAVDINEWKKQIINQKKYGYK